MASEKGAIEVGALDGFPIYIKQFNYGFRFGTPEPDGMTWGETPEVVVRRVKSARKRATVPIAIPVVIRHGRRHVRAILRGRHARTREWLVTLTQGDEKLSIEYLNIVAMDDELTDEELATLNSLLDEMDALSRRYNETERVIFKAKCKQKGGYAPEHLLRAVQDKELTPDEAAAS